MSDEGGVWRTVGGRRIFIKDGEDLETAMKNSGKFERELRDIDREKERTKLIEEDVKKHNLPNTVRDDLLSNTGAQRAQGIVGLTKFVAENEEYYDIETHRWAGTDFKVTDVDGNRVNITMKDYTYDRVLKKIEEHYKKKGHR